MLKNTNMKHKKSEVGRPASTLPNEVYMGRVLPEKPNRYQKRKMKKLIKQGRLVPLIKWKDK
mgnify:CR=1 FL=1